MALRDEFAAIFRWLPSEEAEASVIALSWAAAMGGNEAAQHRVSPPPNVFELYGDTQGPPVLEGAVAPGLEIGVALYRGYSLDFLQNVKKN